MMNSSQRKVFHHPLPTSHYDEIDYVHSSYSFPEKLSIILENNSIDCAQWAENGICFRIGKEEEFLNKIMPQYFKQTKMTSFQRQLNSYGFRKISRGVDSGCYFHPKFQKSRPDLLLDVHRLPAKGSLESYEEVQFSKRKDVSFDYDRTKTKKSRKEVKPIIDIKHRGQQSLTFVGHAVSPISTTSPDDSSISSLSSAENEMNEIPYSLPPVSTKIASFKGPYLFLGCGAPTTMTYDEKYHQYQLYEQHCIERVAQAQQQHQQEQHLEYIYENEVAPIPMFLPHPVNAQYEYIPPVTTSPYEFVQPTNTCINTENYNGSHLDYTFLKSDVLDMFFNPSFTSTIDQQEQTTDISYISTDNKEDWADSLLNMPWITASNDEYDLII